VRFSTNCRAITFKSTEAMKARVIRRTLAGDAFFATERELPRLWPVFF
jgi:hypothetical protein